MNPEQIKMLVESGKLTPDDIAQFDPKEKAVYERLTKSYPAAVMDRFTGSLKDAAAHPGRTAGYAALGTAGGLMLPVGAGATGIVAGAAKAIPQMAGGAAGMYAIEKLKQAGLPASIANGLEAYLGFKMMMGGGGSGAASGAVAKTAAEAATAAEESTAFKEMKAKIFPKGNVDRGRTMDPLSAGEGGSMGERVIKGGVKVDQSGPRQRSYQDINLRDAYPGNIKTESNTNDIIEMLTRSSSKGSPSPLVVHGDDELKNAINGIKRLKRRNPQ